MTGRIEPRSAGSTPPAGGQATGGQATGGRAADPRGEATADRTAEQRLRVQLVASALTQALDPKEVGSRILRAVTAELKAPQGWVAILRAGGDEVEILDAAGYGPDVLRPSTRVPLAAQVPMTEVVRTGRPLYHSTAAARHEAYPALGSPARWSGTEGSAVVPLAFEGKVTGALAVGFHGPRTLDADERWFLETLAAQASVGLERARLFAEVLDSEARLEDTLEASGIGTWEWLVDEDRIRWSPIQSRLHGLPPGAEPPGFAAWLEQVHPDDRAAVHAAMEARRRDGKRYDTEVRLQLPDGGIRWIHSSGRYFPAADGRPARMLGTSQDITDRKRAEADRDRMLAAEREAARLRDAFTGVVSHELRTPITTIFGGTRVLARRWRDMPPADRDELLEDVVAEADRLYRLVEDLLVLTRVERGTLDVGDEPVSIARVAERVLATERPRWPGVSFELRTPVDLPSVAGEETYVEQVLRNLLANAAKYGGQGSSVTLTTETVDGEVVVRVDDEGPGIDPAETGQLFDLFFRSPRTAATVPGAGIGLFVCRQLVEAMGGRIVAEARPTGGASFAVHLPAYGDDDGL